jgi:hypothetical protein
VLARRSWQACGSRRRKVADKAAAESDRAPVRGSIVGSGAGMSRSVRSVEAEQSRSLL